jgi:dihydrofolate reductase
MRKVIVLAFMTLDGVIQAPGGPKEDTSGGFKYGGWVFPFSDETLGEAIGEQMSTKCDLLLGRKTYEIFASYWPDHESDWPGINNAKKYVASNTLSTTEWNNSIILKGSIVEQINELKQQDGPDLHVYGSANFIQTLLKHDLIDEFWLKIFPITLGNGKRLFEKGTLPGNFKMLNGKISPGGVIIASYARDGEVKTGTLGT